MDMDKHSSSSSQLEENLTSTEPATFGSAGGGGVTLVAAAAALVGVLVLVVCAVVVVVCCVRAHLQHGGGGGGQVPELRKFQYYLPDGGGKSAGFAGGDGQDSGCVLAKLGLKPAAPSAQPRVFHVIQRDGAGRPGPVVLSQDGTAPASVSGSGSGSEDGRLINSSLNTTSSGSDGMMTTSCSGSSGMMSSSCASSGHEPSVVRQGEERQLHGPPPPRGRHGDLTDTPQPPPVLVYDPVSFAETRPSHRGSRKHFRKKRAPRQPQHGAGRMEGDRGRSYHSLDSVESVDGERRQQQYPARHNVPLPASHSVLSQNSIASTDTAEFIDRQNKRQGLGRNNDISILTQSEMSINVRSCPNSPIVSRTPGFIRKSMKRRIKVMNPAINSVPQIDTSTGEYTDDDLHCTADSCTEYEYFSEPECVEYSQEISTCF